MVIVNVSTLTGTGSLLPYVMSKAGPDAMTLALAPRVRVNAVLPGHVEGRWMHNGPGEAVCEQVKTAHAAQYALGRVAMPEHIAHAIGWLLHLASIVTGQQLVVDAGFLLGKLPMATGTSNESSVP